MMSDALKIKCYAKVNLYLNVLPPSANESYHKIESLFHSISLYDELSVSPVVKKEINQITFLPTSHPKIALKTTHYNLQENNLLIKVLEFFQKEFSIPPVLLRLKKNIPVGAGLGGGSSNAAGLILVLNKMFNLQLTEDQKKQIAIKFGSDIPFFLQGGLAIVEGIGEKITPLDFSLNDQLLLVYPEEFIATSLAYKKNVQLNNNDNFSSLKKNLLAANKKNNRSLPPLPEFFYNAFEKKTLEYYPKIKKVYHLLLNKTPHVLLSGSGSSLYAWFNDSTILNQSHKELQGKKLNFIYKVNLTNKAFSFINDNH